ncbi:MAG: SIS domain-containing protein [Bacteroidales bacterium]|nr:SIS domain-containing protein [Bacteroidales bacterium]
MGSEIVDDLFERYPALKECKVDILEAIQEVSNCYLNKGKLLLCGNGGSCSDADHIVGELMKSFEKKRPLDSSLEKKLESVSEERGEYIGRKLQNALPAISLNAHSSLYSAIANDIDPNLVFAQQILGYGNSGDVLIALSTSGNSQNVIDAAITAKAKGLKVIGLTGQTGGKIKEFCDVIIRVPSTSTPEVQEFHLPVYHTICKYIEDKFF